MLLFTILLSNNGCLSDSEWLSITDAPREISNCFKFPVSGENDSPKIENTQAGSKRNLILVGHDIATDVNYLRKIGYDPLNLANLQEVVDTVSMYRALEREPNPRNLGSILENLDIAGWYLHNAGNDAVYTLQAMIGIAIKGMIPRPDPKPQTSMIGVDITQ